VLKLEPLFARLEARARRETPGGAALIRTADLRYAGQSYEINVPWAGAEAAFHKEHARLYGFANPGRRVEVVTIRVRARAASEKPKLPKAPRAKVAAVTASETRRIHSGGRWRSTLVVPRLAVGAAPRPGPLLVTDYGSTTLVPPGWSAQLDRIGNLLLSPS